VVFSVPEDKVGLLRPGSDVAVRVWASNSQLTGHIREVAASADPVTRTFQVKVALEGATQPPLGATVAVLPKVLGHAGAQVIKIPTSALRQDGQGSAVWLLDRQTMTLKSQPVQVATADGNDAVISAGLVPGMVIVSAGVHVLAAGQKVSVWQEKTSALPPLAAQPQPQPHPVPGEAQAATLPVTR
jgi:multidrug efflux system membrane fusion protein